MQSTRLIFEKKSKFDTAFEGKAVENLYFCSQINRNLYVLSEGNATGEVC